MRLDEKILMELGETICKLENLNSTKKCWLNNKQAEDEFQEIVNIMKQVWLKLDEFFAIWVRERLYKEKDEE